MSVYPEYHLETYNAMTGEWQMHALGASNRPHFYGVLHAEYSAMIANAKENTGPGQMPCGYRIMVRGTEVMDIWANREHLRGDKCLS